MKKNVLLGITGSIAAYKSLILARLLVKKGCNVKVVMSKDAEKFIHPNSFAAITNNSVISALFCNSDETMAHIQYAKWADIFLICPASANTIGKLATGIYDNLLTVICCATKAKIFLAPAMNKNMWENYIVQQNIKKLKKADYRFIYPKVGEQACGDFGDGRMEEPENIVNTLFAPLPLQGYNILITAGPTIEKIDPIRYITNGSSGKMGYAIASCLHEKGANVSLITGPTHIAKPTVNKVIEVTTAEEMYEATLKELSEKEAFFSVAAVSDYVPCDFSEIKIKKEKKDISVKFKMTKDILSEVSNSQNRPNIVVGFAAETNNVINNAQKKLFEKKLNYIVINKVSNSGFPFNSEQNEVVVLDKYGNAESISKSNKLEIAEKIYQIIFKGAILNFV